MAVRQRVMADRPNRYQETWRENVSYHKAQVIQSLPTAGGFWQNIWDPVQGYAGFRYAIKPEFWSHGIDPVAFTYGYVRLRRVIVDCSYIVPDVMSTNVSVYLDDGKTTINYLGHGNTNGVVSTGSYRQSLLASQYFPPSVPETNPTGYHRFQMDQKSNAKVYFGDWADHTPGLDVRIYGPILCTVEEIGITITLFWEFTVNG